MQVCSYTFDSMSVEAILCRTSLSLALLFSMKLGNRGCSKKNVNKGAWVIPDNDNQIAKSTAKSIDSLESAKVCSNLKCLMNLWLV